ncbi:MAG: BamA/TamA family outer membrane protein [Candidatus Marinimicrobia bacterium]|nr:BamA/TamA family outer membrane protein [Candidatus Neomarinimicrobiota bacterium]
MIILLICPSGKLLSADSTHHSTTLSFSNSITTSPFFGQITINSDSAIHSPLFTGLTKSYFSILFDTTNYNQFTKQLMTLPAAEGFLFPNLTMTQIHPLVISDSLYINPVFSLHVGERVIIDTLIFQNLDKTKPELLVRDLKFLAGQKYTSHTHNLIKQSLKKYSFLNFTNETQIIRTSKGRFGLLVSLQEQQANGFNGVIGYVPRTANLEGYFTGQLNIDLKNIAGMGRGFKIYWARVNSNSQELKLNYFEPHLAGSHFFTNFGFDQTLRDTLLVLRSFHIGLGNDISRLGTLEILADYESTLPTPAGRELLSLSKNKVLKAGLQTSFDTRDLRTNPTRGIFFSANNYLGTRKKNHRQKIMTQTEISAEINFQLPQKLIFNINSHYAAKFIKDSKLDYSDQLWFGGATSLRGYAEDFFSGSEIGLAGIEVRWITGYYSRIFVFFDQGYYKTSDNNIYWPRSFGIGMRLESRMGTIGLDYAFGEDDTFTTAKIHLHLENRF